MVSPILSVVIPTYNRKDLLKECLESLFNQTYPKEDYEIVVVDDGSTDGTEEALKGLRAEHGNLRYFRQENKGAYHACNTGILCSRGEIVAFTDSDCTAPRDFLELMAFYFKKYPGICACIGYTVPVFKDGFFCLLSEYYRRVFESSEHKEKVFSRLDPTVILHTDCAAVKKSALMDIKYFGDKFTHAWGGGDPDVGFKLLEKGYGILTSNKIFVYHRQRDTILDLIKREYAFGTWDAVNLKDFFKGWVGIYINEGGFSRRTNLPVTFLFHVTPLKITFFLLLLMPFFPLAGISMLSAYIFMRYLGIRKMGGNAKLFLVFMLHRYITDGSRLSGWIVGSIKHGVIYL
ncbi:MAG: glycosyltransferase [Candidatus Omnitrophota bacterium]|jgi:glycosyltransferase involved in cell wall biosynthesis